MSKFNIEKQGIPTLASAYANVLGNNSSNQIIEIPNEKIIENNNQHFKIHDDTIEQLAERIAKDGQLNPCIVCPLPDGTYELVDGRHRRRAVIKAGLPTTKCIIRSDLTDKQKASFRISLNLFRNNDYLPSEIALSLKELIEIEGSYDAIKKVSDETNTSRKKIYRYVRLTHLIKPLLDRVDNGNIPVIAAVELSYLSEAEQKKLFEYLLNHSDCKISTATAREIKENPSDLDNIFYPISNLPKLDNLSTIESDDTSTEVNETEKAIETDNTNSSSVGKKSDNSFINENYTTINDIEELSTEHKNLIARVVIGITKVDYYIVKQFYNSSEVLEYLNEKYVNHHSARYSEYDNYYIGIEFNFFNRKFCFKIDKAKETSFLMSHKLLEKIIREYIRSNYTDEKIISIVQGQNNNE